MNLSSKCPFVLRTISFQDCLRFGSAILFAYFSCGNSRREHFHMLLFQQLLDVFKSRALILKKKGKEVRLRTMKLYTDEGAELTSIHI